ncbi:unnamed protein product [Trifolium pratense]|uniref:Uncharacterized protein n=1 Tax=Trifolium pratense TaxID=57577 RepID=A0ACB0K5C3_TRIPR|nr:unnamed protein product [Trifolium pratense]
MSLKHKNNITLPHRTLDVPHDVSVLIVQELNSDLGHLTPGSSSSHNFHNKGMFDLRFHPVETLGVGDSVSKRRRRLIAMKPKKAA